MFFADISIPPIGSTLKLMEVACPIFGSLFLFTSSLKMQIHFI